MPCLIFTTPPLRKIANYRVRKSVIILIILTFKNMYWIDLQQQISTIDLSPLQKGINDLNGALNGQQSSITGNHSSFFK